MNGAELIAAERQRQVDAEGWTPEHDDEYDDEQLSFAAACYLLTGKVNIDGEDLSLRYWPWSFLYWKPSDDSIRNLVKAGGVDRRRD